MSPNENGNTNRGRLLEEHVPEHLVVDLHAGDCRRGLLRSPPHHDGVGGGDHGVLLVSNVERDGVNEGVAVHLVVVDRALVPNLVGRFVVDVSKVPA